jgi:UDP-N-acetyl-D-glucosamine dehydrogenase
VHPELTNQPHIGEEEEGPAGTAAVVGLGYVGLPLALLFADKRFRVIGVDVNPRKIDSIRQGISDVPDVDDGRLKEALASGAFTATDDFGAISAAEAVIICVPTPLTSYHTPDLHYLQSAAQAIGRHLRAGQLVVLESSTFPGTTREVLKPILERASGLKAGSDFHIGYSPERIDPGNERFRVEQIPKLTSGLTDACARLTARLYGRVFDRTVPVSSPETAEMTKLVENAQRLVNISFMNELAVICDEMRIDVWEVIGAAATKPFGFTPYYPGPGIGGHCIPVDPLYLQWKAGQFGIASKFIQLSADWNRSFPAYLADRIQAMVAGPEQPRVLLYGVAYKRDVNDSRESPALELIRLLQGRGIDTAYHDPFIPSIALGDRRMDSVELTDELLRRQDCIVIFTDHSVMPILRIVTESKLVFDTRNATAGMGERRNVIRLGSGSRFTRSG